jgi:3-hydroxy-9,10-secoandrosta-1,3,5(10)-triene-9,17-dione monooxygenase
VSKSSKALSGNAIPDREELVARAVALQPLLIEHAAKIDADRRLPDEVNTALTDAGMFRLFTPKRLGGYGADLRTVMEVIETLGVADASAAWLVAIASNASWLIGRVSKQAQDEVFGTNPDARVAGSGDPAGAVRVDGGVRMSGRWSYASGSHEATWACLGGLLTDDAGAVLDVVMGFVPAADVSLEDTWHTVGMRGTGSNTFVGQDVFVPDHRLVSIPAVVEGSWPVPTDDPIYRVPFVPVATSLVLGPLLGAGRAALELVIDKAPRKALHHTFFAKQSDSVGVQIQLAEAAMKLRTARLHAYDIADHVDAVAAGEGIDFETRARIRGQAGYAAQQVLDAIHVLVNIHGAGSFAESSRMQQIWRDANTGARHAGLNAVVGYEVYGKALLDVDERITAMV